MSRRKTLLLVRTLLVLAALAAGACLWAAGSVSKQPMKARDTESIIEMREKRLTQADREAAAARAAVARQAVAISRQGFSGAFPGAVSARPQLAPVPGGTPDYFSVYPNYANSPLPVPAGGGGVVAGTGIRKFVDGLPGLGPTNANNLGQYIPVANADTKTYAGSDYYEINLVQYTEKLHSDLPPTTLRGYVQVNSGTDGAGNNTIAPAPVHYLGPLIIAQRDRPVRIKFRNMLPTGAGGNLSIPVDTTYMGAGQGPLGTAVPAGTPVNYTENRATLHLHGGVTPWISDGTPHQWTTPSGENTAYPEGVSVYNVPDMDGGAEPQGTLTFYYTNQQSARLMFYHDHAYGITRLNVYAGEAAGYVLQDTVEQGLVTAGTIPAEQIPLIIQDKSFVPDNATSYTNLVGTFPSQLAAQDPTWDSAKYGGFGQLWFPHVYMPNQNPYDISGANAMGRWDYGPWFWPPYTGIQFGPVLNPLYDPVGAPWEPPYNPGTPNPSGTPESFLDTPMVNGTAYPVMHVKPQAYRFRILNACNDRFVNLQLYKAKSSAAMWNLDGPGGTPGTLNDANAGEVNMVEAFPRTGLPPTWPTDARDGGVPNPADVGPDWIQIGTEGGILPAPVVIPPTPVGYVFNRRDIVVLNVDQKCLFLGPAERADVIVDFSGIPSGTKLIMYNDAPAPVPASDPRLDYYTGNPDMTDTGGAPSTLPGYGPNTRTIMQIVVDPGTPAATFDLAALQAALPAAFAASQDTIIVPQTAYDPVYGTTTPNAAQYVPIQGTTHAFTPIGQTTPLTVDLFPKALHELFTVDYGRMNGLLAVERPMTNFLNQTTIPYGYIDPPTEVMRVTDTATPMGTALDGTQIWKITHNGVDTHAMHFHLFNVQVINRVGWDGAVRMPDGNELGWKDTVRMNPLEDIIVALRPLTVTNLPWKLPNSIRPLDVTQPIGSPMGFFNVDPNGNPVTVLNQLANFGWEYVWHCHLLGHEENDMMRPIAAAVPPEDPTGLVASAIGSQVRLNWVDNSLNATSFRVDRATDAGFTTNLTSVNLGRVTTYTSTVPAIGDYFYRVQAANTVGSTVPGYPSGTVYSRLPSNTAPIHVGPPTGTTTITSITQAIAIGAPVVINWSYLPGGDQTGFTIQRARNAAFTASLQTYTVNAGTRSYTNTTGLAVGTTYYYRVRPSNGWGVGAWSATASFTTRTLPQGTVALTSVTQGAGVGAAITLTWTYAPAGDQTGFRIQRANNPGFANAVNYTAGLNARSYINTTTLVPGTRYYYRVCAANVFGNSPWSNAMDILAH